MGSRYHMLPSQILAQATTVDYYVFDRALTYENKKKRQAQGLPTNKEPPKLTEKQMQAMLAKTRGKKNVKR